MKNNVMQFLEILTLILAFINMVISLFINPSSFFGWALAVIYILRYMLIDPKYKSK